MNILIGNTGLVGSTLKDSVEFNYEFNSSNIQELSNLNIEFSNCNLYLCCLPATKWIVNNNPSKDLSNILSIVAILSKKSFKNIVLYSTIDIYQNAPTHSDETYSPEITSLNYGSNRYLFEQLIRTTTQYENLLVIRLPALFGKHLKKNVLFDLLNKNEIQKINYNSQYQWYNLDNLHRDTTNCLAITNGFLEYNLFPEPTKTSDILKIFNLGKDDVDNESKEVLYDYKARASIEGYIAKASDVLEDIRSFVAKYRVSKIRIAVCLFGEERDLLSRLQDWKTFQSHTNSDFFLSLYSNNNVTNTVEKIRETLPLKAYSVFDNNLELFDSKKYRAKQPTYLYGVDVKATFARITSQLYIRQQVTSMVDLDQYDVILLCRTDLSNFNITKEDLYKVYSNKNLLVVNSGTHDHPGGGGGCTECSEKVKCLNKYHANDICDHWCVGSTMVMKNWNRVYDDALELYGSIQSEGISLHETGIRHAELRDTSEVIFYPEISNLIVIENIVHCYYPEKIMRPLFKDVKIINATHNKDIWR